MSNARNYIRINDIVNDYLVTRDDDDLDRYYNPTQIKVIALRGMRELQYDTLRRIKSVRLPINKTLNIVTLPTDYVDYCKIGILGSDCMVYVLGQNDNINISGDVLLDQLNRPLLDHDGRELLGETICEPEVNLSNNFIRFGYAFNNYYYDGSYGRLFGLGGGNNVRGNYRINLEDNRITLDDFAVQNNDDIILEYIADETMSENPLIASYAEEAIHNWIYYQICKKKRNVAANEKERAKRD